MVCFLFLLFSAFSPWSGHSFLSPAVSSVFNPYPSLPVFQCLFCFILSMGTGYSPQSRIRTIRDSLLSGFYCRLPYQLKRRFAMPHACSVLLTYLDTLPSDSIHILPQLRAHTCRHPHNRWSCPNTPQWRPACSSHIHPAVLTPPGHTRLHRWAGLF